MSENQLKQSTSPYLLQHADNPVHWWPWCDQALQLAREQDRPILLSIGYSACHWCHVMAHESFENPTTAAVMNELFVNIKVDREERPDLDKIYQTAHQLLSQRPGGWPLTVFLTPDDHVPFFAGTYFPPEPRHGLLSFVELMQRVHAAYREQHDAIAEQNQALQQAMQRLAPAPGESPPDAQLLLATVAQLYQYFDAQHGGIGGAPKFPHPNTLEFLLRQAQRHGDKQARHMALFTLERMARGGINDQLGGGFCRYSTDAEWIIPHFEKMLYDNGPLLALYADAWQLDAHRPSWRHVCERTAEWLMREMQTAAGGYSSSLDADSEGEEGRFYVWDREQVAGLLEADEYDLIAARYGLDRPANFEGHWHLYQAVDTAQLTEASGLSAGEVRKRLRNARDKLLAAREQRIRPGRDDKILTSWNALAIKGMARAGRLLDRPDWIASAQAALDYLRRSHWRDGRLLATSRDGHAHLAAYLDDHAYLLDALLEMLQVRWDNADLAFAQQLAEVMLAHFEDREHGGFFFTADDHEALLTRIKPFTDDAMPAGNAVAAFALQRLGLLLGDSRYLAAAERTLTAAADAMAATPYAHCGLMIALQEYLEAGETLVIRGTNNNLALWRQQAQQAYHPWRQTYCVASDAPDLPEALAVKKPDPHGATLAYRCRGLQCDAPLHDPADLA